MLTWKNVPITLEVPVSESGYLLVDAKVVQDEGESRYRQGLHQMITHGLPASSSGLLSKTVEPLEVDSAIHRNFAALDLFAALDSTGQAFVRFAGRFGMLGGGLEVPIEVSAGGSLPRPVLSVGEPVEAWSEEVAALRSAIRLWDLIQSGSTGELKYFLEREKAELPHRHHEMLEAGRPDGAALFILKKALRERLEGQVVFSMASVDDGRSFALTPRNLRAGLWFMLAREINDKRHYRSCSQCGTWYEVRAGAKRATRVYCSNACRTKAYRARQDRAKRLQHEGIPTGEIARRLETDIDTVEGWVEDYSGEGQKQSVGR